NSVYHRKPAGIWLKTNHPCSFEQGWNVNSFNQSGPYRIALQFLYRPLAASAGVTALQDARKTTRANTASSFCIVMDFVHNNLHKTQILCQ
ncbi:MAG TPA: hypothetical protein VIK80_07165, partial [Flavihumibacter sp.]